MKKLIGLLLAAVMLFTVCCAVGEDSGERLTGQIENGSYILTVETDPEDLGTWEADEMAQDPFVVRLAESGTGNGVFTARYEPTGDGDVTVSLRHFTERKICDQMHTFDLHVQDGAVQEVTGGSMTASPAEDDLDPAISGEWLEKETQFTVLDVTRKVEGGWEIELTSPVSHGAWAIRGTAFFDCDWDAFVYSDGVKQNLPEQEGNPEQTGLWGTLRFAGTEGSPQIVWSEGLEGDEVVFERAPALPAYEYTGEDEIEGAVANALAQNERAEHFLKEAGCVTIPCPIIHRTEVTDDSHATVYGSFWILNYVKRGNVLKNISGGEYAGVMTLEKAEGVWHMTDLREAGDGSDYAADIEAFAAGDLELMKMYFEASDLLAEPQHAVRIRLIRDYVNANQLGITAYQDYGWDPVELAE